MKYILFLFILIGCSENNHTYFPLGKIKSWSYKVEKVNPQLEVIYYGTINLEKKGVEKTATRFNITQNGKVTISGNLFKKLVPEN